MGKNIEGQLVQPFHSIDRTNHGPDMWNRPSDGVLGRFYIRSQYCKLGEGAGPVQYPGSLCHCDSARTLKCLKCIVLLSVAEPVIEYLWSSYEMATTPLGARDASDTPGNEAWSGQYSSPSRYESLSVCNVVSLY